MRRAILYLILLAAGVAGALWFAEIGGTVEVRVGDTFIGVPMPIALLLLLAAFLILHLLLLAIGALRRWPRRMAARRAERRRQDGEKALTRALLALASGTGDAARVETRRARQLLGDTPQTLLLAAEAERMAGREAEATQVFQLLADRSDAKFLGLRGLLRQAIQREDWPTALRLAREAEKVAPGAAWLKEERATLALRTRDWREALALAPPEAPQAALALAAAGQEPDPAKAAELERKAFSLDPGFAPAALAHARRLRHTGSPRRGQQVLEQAWAARPHPDLATAYLADISDPLAKVKAVETLAGRNRAHPESRLLMANAAIAAGLSGRARQELDALVASGQVDRRAYLALSDLEEAEHGDKPEGRAAQAKWLRQAATAAPESRWRCSACGTDHAQWTAVCPNCQAVGTIAWTSPQSLPVPAEAPRAG